VANSWYFTSDLLENIEIKSQLHLNRYINFINSRQIMLKKNKEKYLELHHKTPRTLGGTNVKNNLILLSAREHFIAHMMLWKAIGGKMTYAFWMMSNSKKYNQKLTSKQYSSLKYKISKNMVEFNSKRDHHPMLGRKHSKETIKKLSESHIGNNSALGLKRSEEFKHKISLAQTGKTYSEETKLKKSKSMTGKKWTEEQKKRQSDRIKLWYKTRIKK